ARPPPGDAGVRLQVDLPGARAAGLDTLVLAVFVEGPAAAERGFLPPAPVHPAGGLHPPGAASPARITGVRAGVEMAQLLGEIESRSRGAAARATSTVEILANRSRGVLSLVLSLENAGDACEGSLRILEVYLQLGARLA